MIEEILIYYNYKEIYYKEIKIYYKRNLIFFKKIKDKIHFYILTSKNDYFTYLGKHIKSNKFSDYKENTLYPLIISEKIIAFLNSIKLDISYDDLLEQTNKINYKNQDIFKKDEFLEMVASFNSFYKYSIFSEEILDKNYLNIFSNQYNKYRVNLYIKVDNIFFNYLKEEKGNIKISEKTVKFYLEEYSNFLEQLVLENTNEEYYISLLQALSYSNNYDIFSLNKKNLYLNLHFIYKKSKNNSIKNNKFLDLNNEEYAILLERIIFISELKYLIQDKYIFFKDLFVDSINFIYINYNLDTLTNILDRQKDFLLLNKLNWNFSLSFYNKYMDNIIEKTFYKYYSYSFFGNIEKLYNILKKEDFRTNIYIINDIGLIKFLEDVNNMFYNKEDLLKNISISKINFSYKYKDNIYLSKFIIENFFNLFLFNLINLNFHDKNIQKKENYLFLKETNNLIFEHYCNLNNLKKTGEFKGLAFEQKVFDIIDSFIDSFPNIYYLKNISFIKINNEKINITKDSGEIDLLFFDKKFKKIIFIEIKNPLNLSSLYSFKNMLDTEKFFDSEYKKVKNKVNYILEQCNKYKEVIFLNEEKEFSIFLEDKWEIKSFFISSTISPYLDFKSKEYSFILPNGIKKFLKEFLNAEEIL